jgi:hypothetical protein
MGKTQSLNATTWLLRSLLGLGGAVLVYVGWPVAGGALQAQKADSVVFELRSGGPVTAADLQIALQAMDRAVAADPVAGRRLARSELTAGAALTPGLDMSPTERTEMMRQAASDLDFGLGNDPARSAAWLRLASARQTLEGTSARVVAAIMMAIETAPMLEEAWPARLQLILDNWRDFTPRQRDRASDSVAAAWRASTDRRRFAAVIRSPLDELFVRYFVRNEPDAQEELTKWLAQLGKK